jgi:hypothetical protein
VDRRRPGGVTVDSVRRIALGPRRRSRDRLPRRRQHRRDTPTSTTKQVALIMRAPVDDDLKQTMLRARERRERDRQRRLEDFQEMLDDLAARKNEG